MTSDVERETLSGGDFDTPDGTLFNFGGRDPDGVLVSVGGLLPPLGFLSNFGAEDVRPTCGLSAAEVASFVLPPNPKVGIDFGMLGKYPAAFCEYVCCGLGLPSLGALPGVGSCLGGDETSEALFATSGVDGCWLR